MGLDMYLTGTAYVEDWAHNYTGGVIPEDSKAKLCARACGVDLPCREVVFDVAYWRKANAVHKWFVDNVQGGVDDCGSYYVDVDQLRTLVGRATKVLADKTTAAEELPTQGGFFFGGVEYDNYYLQDLEYTKVTLEGILARLDCESLQFKYQSSW